MRKIVFLSFLLLSFNVFAATFKLPSNGDIVGKVQWTQSLPGDDFITVGRRYDIGYYELVEANPGVNPALPHPGTLVVIPTRFVLPNEPHTGIVVNTAELRVYYFPPNTNEVITYPCGVGRENWVTPVGKTSVIQKVKNPTWVVPADIMKWRMDNGHVQLPKSIAPGPDNPLGGYALYLGFAGYRMHGTNDPTGVGRRSSSGCIRMWPEDIEELFSKVTVGTQVRIIDTPYKTGWLDGKLYLESHTPLEEQQKAYAKNFVPLRANIQGVTTNEPANVDWARAKEVARQQNGIPQVVGEAT